MQKAGVETVAGADGIDYLDWTRRSTPGLCARVRGNSMCAALNDQERNKLRKSSDGPIRLRLPCQLAGFTFVRHEYINKTQRLQDAAIPLACRTDRKSTRLNSSHMSISYAV